MPFPTKSAAVGHANNSSTSGGSLFFEDDPSARGVKITALVLIFVFCLIGNCLLIAVVYKNANQRMRTPSNYFILNMACADMLLVVYSVPQYIAMTVSDFQWIVGGVTGEILCRLSFFVGQMPVLVSTGSLFVIALDRYFLVFYPLKRLITLQTSRRIIAGVWISATLFTVPLFAMASLIEIHPGILICTFDFSMIAFVINYFLFCYTTIIAIPLIIIVILYIAIGFKIKRAAPPGNQLPSTQERRERVTHKVLAMLVAIVVALILLRFPLIIFLITCFSGSTSLCGKFNVMFAAWFLTFTNSTVNPWIYFIFNEQFRHGARLILHRIVPCCFKTTNIVDAAHTSAHQTAGSPKDVDETVHLD